MLSQTLVGRRVYLCVAFINAIIFIFFVYLVAFALKWDAEARCDETCMAKMRAVVAGTPSPFLRDGNHIAHMTIYVPILFTTMISSAFLPVLQCRLGILCGAVMGGIGTAMWLCVVVTTDVSWATVYGPFAMWCSISMCIASSLAMERNARRAFENAHAQERFTASVSHELRTPLNAIIGNAHLMGRMLEGGRLDKESMRTFLSRIDVSSTLLMSLVNDILDYSSIKAGQFALSRSACDIRAIVNTAIDLVRQHAAAKDLRLRVSVDTEVPSAIISDSRRVQQVVLNLLSNAVRYTVRGHIEIGVEMVSLPVSSLDCPSAVVAGLCPPPFL